MNVFEKIPEIRQFLVSKKPSNSIGFVPTMGALHDGHLSLIKEARKENDKVVCSIFVNPNQFDNKNDLLRYPSSLDEDRGLLEACSCDAVFIPANDEMYPDNESHDKEVFDFGNLEKVMEGKHRPGHFRGVATIVSKLFRIIEPDRAYFGEKDYQQLLIIRKLVDLQRMPYEIIACPTIREPDGFAMSSRNKRLNADQRDEASVIFHTLCMAKEKVPVASPTDIKEWVNRQFQSNPEFSLEYFEIVDAETLMPVSKWDDANRIIACMAATTGEIRLIDNLILIP